MKVVGFRLSDSDVGRLEKEAKNRGVSKSDLGRELLLSALDRAEGDPMASAAGELKAQIESLERELLTLKGAMSKSVQAILLTSDKYNLEKVALFVGKVFKE